jgi:predicted Zn-dependent peptidase
LDNGLVVRSVRRRHDEAVAVQLWLPAGARFEGAAPAGVAAAVAELTRRSAVAQLPTTVSISAWVEADSTVFGLVTTPADLDESLGVLVASVSAVDTDPTHINAARSARAAMVAELRTTPALRGLEALLAEAYSVQGLGRPAVGGDPKAWTPAAISAFHGAHYGPRGAHLVMVGPEPERDAVDRAERHWSRWRGSTSPRPVEPAIPAPPRIVVERSTTAAGLVRVALRLELKSPRDAAVFDLVARLLGTERTGRIAHAAQARRLALTSARAYVYGPVGPGQLVIELDGAPADVDTIWSVAAGVLASLREIPPTEAELTPCREALLATEARQRATPDAYAERLGRGMTRWPADPEGVAWRKAVSTLRATEVSESALRILSRDRVTAVVLVPPVEDAVDDAFWAETLSERLEVVERSPPVSSAAGRVELRPGLEVVAHPIPHSGVVAIHVISGGGLQAEGAHERGVALMAARLWKTVSPSVEVKATAGAITASTLSAPATFERDLTALTDGLRGAQWTPSMFEAARARAAQVAGSLPQTPDRWARWLAGGRGTMPPADLAAAIERAGPTLVSPWYLTHLRGADTTVAIVGDVAPDRAYRAVRAAFEGTALAAPGVSLRATVDTPPVVKRAVDTGAAQRWYSFELDVRTAEDRATLAVVEALLSAPGDTLVSHDELVGGRGRWAIGISGDTKAMETRWAALTRGLETVRTSVFPEEQVRLAVKRVTARETVRLRDPAVRAQWLAEQARAGRSLTGSRAVALWRATLGRVEPTDVHRFASTKLAKPAVEVRVEARPTPAAPRPQDVEDRQ